MEYKELAKVFYMDSSSDREGNLAIEESRRRNSVGTFRLNFKVEAVELFIAVPKELTALTELVLRTERAVTLLLNKMSPIAANAVLRGLVLDEVVFTNAIEGIHSTRRQIKDALETMSDDVARRRFKELALLYMNIVLDKAEEPSAPEDVRSIYDKVMDGELDDAYLPDGVLFRKEGVDVVSGVNVIHRGLEPEEKIIEAMEAMIELIENVEVPSLYSALASHYLFEYAHPFYDGNGRTGRYLCSLMLSKSLSKPTVLSLSRVILENREKYYKAFRSVENPLNKGELTFFVIAMMELVRKAQLDVINRLELAVKRQGELQGVMKEVVERIDLRKKQEQEIVFMLMQYETFGLFGDASVEEVAEHLKVGSQAARKHLRALEEKRLAVKVNQRRPVTFGLSESFKQAYGIEPLASHPCGE